MYMYTYEQACTYKTLNVYISHINVQINTYIYIHIYMWTIICFHTIAYTKLHECKYMRICVESGRHLPSQHTRHEAVAVALTAQSRLGGQIVQTCVHIIQSGRDTECNGNIENQWMYEACTLSLLQDRCAFILTRKIKPSNY